jgi:hypothetical protein
MYGTFYSLSLKGKEPLERPRHRFHNNIRECLKDVEHDGVDWIYLKLCTAKRQAVMKSVIIFGVP